MNRYDWGWNRSYDWSFRPWADRGYGRDFRRYADWRAGPEGSWDWGPARGESWGVGWERGGRGGYDRGVYGDPYPTYRGYPGAGERGTYHGGGPAGRGSARARSYDRGYGRGYDRGFGRPPARDFAGEPRRPAPTWQRAQEYDSGFARETFLPESAYLRHPELDRPQRHLSNRWPDSAPADAGEERDDEEIRRSVRQNLFNDSWVHADRIRVEVADHVVTLKGEVDDYLEARYAWDDAWEAEGVRGVINQLTVRTDQPASGHGDVLPQTGGGTK